MNKHTLIYQIYPSSVGDLRDIAAIIPRIAEKLHPNYIWLNPFFESPWNDGGYDVSNYYRIEPRFGKMKDFLDHHPSNYFESLYHQDTAVLLHNAEEDGTVFDFPARLEEDDLIVTMLDFMDVRFIR